MKNNKMECIQNIEKFLNDHEKGMLITGTNQYEKHKLVMATINKHFKNAKILFRINAMKNILDEEFIGWTGIKRKSIKSGERVKIGNNFYEFDSFNARKTWYETNSTYDFAIIYPIDAMLRENKFDAIDNLYNRNIKKIFLVSWTDHKYYNYDLISKYYEKQSVYDAAEEDIDYHNRVLNIINKR